MNRCRWQIGADYAYRKRLTGQGGCIAFLDTGICAHPDFNGRIVGWKDFVHNRPSPYDDCGHGTHVAGIAAGDGSMSQGRFRGVAPGCSLVVLKVLDRLGNGSIAHLCRSVDWLLANQYRYHIRVVNISLCSGLGKLHPEDSPFVKKIESLWDARHGSSSRCRKSGSGILYYRRSRKFKTDHHRGIQRFFYLYPDSPTAFFRRRTYP